MFDKIVFITLPSVRVVNVLKGIKYDMFWYALLFFFSIFGRDILIWKSHLINNNIFPITLCEDLRILYVRILFVSVVKRTNKREYKRLSPSKL